MYGNNSDGSGRRRGSQLSILAGLLVAALVVGMLVVRPSSGVLPPTDHRALLLSVLEREGLGPALEALRRAAARDSVVLRDGHQLAHALGRRAVGASGEAGAVIAECSPMFASGCYHGVVEAFLQMRGRVDMRELEAMCASAGSVDRPGPAYECVHGLGHGVLGAVALDVDAALRHCDALDAPGFVAACHAGVFMEAINAALRPGGDHAGHGDHPAGARPALDPGDPYAPCSRYDDPYAAAYWLFQGFVILQSHGFDARAALTTCDAAPGGRAGACYESVGHQLAGLFQRDDRWIVEQCATGGPNRAPRCAGGAALALVGQDWTGGRATRFCAGSPAAWRGDCIRAAGELLAHLAPAADWAGVCTQVEAAGVEPSRPCVTPPPVSNRPRS